MAHKTDLRRMTREWRRELERSLRTINMSIGFVEWDGTWQGDAHETGETPDSLRVIGGEWDPIGRCFLGGVERPALTLRVQKQQTPALASVAQFLAVFGAERSGKTYVGREIALSTLVGKPGSIVFYLLPRFGKAGFVLGDDQSDPDINEGLITILDSQGWLARRNVKDHAWELINGSVLRAFSGKNKQHEEAFLGGECDLAVIEEFREMPDRVFGKLFSRTISRNGRLAIVTSPEAGHMIEQIDRGEWEGKVDFDIHRLRVAKNFFIFDDPDKKILDVAKQIYDDRAYRRRVLGENVSETGADFYNFDTAKHAVTDVPGVPVTQHLWRSDELWLSRDPAWRGEGTLRPDLRMAQDRLVGLDFGAATMSAIECVLTADSWLSEADAIFAGKRAQNKLLYENTRLVVVREHTREDTSVMDFVPNVLFKNGLTPERAVLFCDPSGKARDHVVGQSPVDLLRKQFGYAVYSKPGGSLRLPGIWAIRERLHLRRLLFVRAGCPELIKDMAIVRSIDRPAKEVSRDPHGHRPDALRYIVDNVFPVRDLFRDRRAFQASLDSYLRQDANGQPG